jgi:midasin (ATPase involved in ribosome maturation)
MNVNEVKRTAYQSLATLCGALSTLEVGQFGIMSFGSDPRLVHPLQSNFSHEDGAHLLKTLTFEQVSGRKRMLCLNETRTLNTYALPGINVTSGNVI